jgi:hypothetical protein
MERVSNILGAGVGSGWRWASAVGAAGSSES